MVECIVQTFLCSGYTIGHSLDRHTQFRLPFRKRSLCSALDLWYRTDELRVTLLKPLPILAS